MATFKCESEVGLTCVLYTQKVGGAIKPFAIKVKFTNQFRWGINWGNHLKFAAANCEKSLTILTLLWGILRFFSMDFYGLLRPQWLFRESVVAYTDSGRKSHQ